MLIKTPGNATLKVEDAPLVDRIDAILPQTQCGKCGYYGCRPYAEAIAAGVAEINLCPPGGEEGIRELADLLAVEFKPFCDDIVLKPRSVAFIDETLCIGCTLCTQACPVDAIAGAAKQMHTIIAVECTGCELCVPPCPVNCISMLPQASPVRFAQDETSALEKKRSAAKAAKERYQFRLERIDREKREKAGKLAAREQAIRKQADRQAQVISSDAEIAAQQKIQAAIERARQQAASSTPRNTTNLTAEQKAKISEIEARRAPRTGEYAGAPHDSND